MELVPETLFFTLEKSIRELNNKCQVIFLDMIYLHTKVQKHFGPPSLKMVWKHCDEVDLQIKKNERVFYVTNNIKDDLHTEQRTISSFLMAAYALLQLKWDAEKINICLLRNIPAPMAHFRDYHGDSTYKLTILDCLKGLHVGCDINKWFASSSLMKRCAISSDQSMDWIIPDEVLACKDPTVNRNKDNIRISKPFIEQLKRCGIKVIVRLNGKDFETKMESYSMSYNAIDFKLTQFFHYDIPLEYNSIPSLAQAHQFVAICEKYGGKIAVHCYAGLGRTATMIGCYLIKNYGFESRSACGWLNLCRPGSVMGLQHIFLDEFQKDLGKTKICFNKSVLEHSIARVFSVFSEEINVGGRTSTPLKESSKLSPPDTSPPSTTDNTQRPKQSHKQPDINSLQWDCFVDMTAKVHVAKHKKHQKCTKSQATKN